MRRASIGGAPGPTATELHRRSLFGRAISHLTGPSPAAMMCQAEAWAGLKGEKVTVDDLARARAQLLAEQREPWPPLA